MFFCLAKAEEKMKKYIYFVDDNIRFFENITKNKPKSIFDDPYIGFHKQMHDKYGLSVQFNIFYKNETFDLSRMTDAYKQEWIDSSDWLKFGFHGISEFPDYPYCSATYEEVSHDYDLIMNEVRRFAGQENITNSCVFHWDCMSDEGIRALKERGVVMSVSTNGTPDRSPEIMSALSSGHRERVLLRRPGVSEPFVAIRTVNGRGGMPFICNCNHLPDEESENHYGKIKMYKEPKTGHYCNTPGELTMNAVKLGDFEKEIEGLLKYEYISILIHEQYFYPDYFAYESDFCEKVEKAIVLLEQNGYENIAMCDLINYQK